MIESSPVEKTNGNRRFEIVIAIVIVLMISILVLVGTVRSREVTPPDGVDTYEEWKNIMRPPISADLIEKDSVEYLILRARDRFGPLVLASGPPAYAFDRAGRLVDWTKDSGGPPILGKKYWDWKRSPLPLERVDTWFATSSEDSKPGREDR